MTEKLPFESKLVPIEKRPAWMKLARDRYEFALALDAEDKQLALDDAEFALAEPIKDGGSTQWHRKAAELRVKLNRPCLTENRLQTFTAQVVNDGRQAKPAIKITALDGGTKETAEYFQGRIRQIEYDCNADIAYDSAREQQVNCGRAFIRVTWDYEWRSFRRRIKIQRIDNQFSVVFGPAREYDCSDADYCFVVNSITREEHERKYGKATTAAHTDFAGPENPAPKWFGVGPNGEMIQEAEYWVKDFKDRTLCLLSNGKVYWQDELPDNLAALGVDVEETRQEKDYHVVQYIIDGADILDEHEFPGQYIPIVPQWGREYFLDGRRRTLSLIRYAKDPQRLLNLYVSNIAEQISMMPKTPFWVPTGAIPAGAESAYLNLNNEPRAFVPYNEYDPSDPANKRLSRPSREVNEPPIMALVAGYNQCVDAIKAAMGIYDASLGARSNETSGVGINMRQRQADNANFHFHDNEARTRNHVGRIMLPLIKEMDKGVGERAVRSVEGKTRMVVVGTKWRDPETRKVIHHDLESGNYGVAVSTDKSYTSQREEAFAKMAQMAQAWPGLLQIGGDIVMRNADMPGSEQLADRLEKALPPELQPQKPTEDGQPQIPPQVIQQMKMIQDRAGQVIEGLTEKIHELETELQTRMADLETKKWIVATQEETKRIIASAQLGEEQRQALLLSDLQAVKHRLDLADAERDRKHAAEEAERDRQHQTSLQESNQRAAAEARAAEAAAAQESAAEPSAGETTSAATEPTASPAAPATE